MRKMRLTDLIKINTWFDAEIPKLKGSALYPKIKEKVDELEITALCYKRMAEKVDKEALMSGLYDWPDPDNLPVDCSPSK